MQFCAISFMRPYKQSGRWQEELTMSGTSQTVNSFFVSFLQLAPSPPQINIVTFPTAPGFYVLERLIEQNAEATVSSRFTFPEQLHITT